MDEPAFRAYLRRNGRSQSATDRCVARTNEYLTWLDNAGEQIGESSLTRFVEATAAHTSPKSHLWALAYYFDFSGNENLASRVRTLRQERISDRGVPLTKLQDVSQEVTGKLTGAGIHTTRDLVEATRSSAQLESLATAIGIGSAQLTSICEMSRLIAIRGVSIARARLYVDCVGSIEALARLSPQELIAQTRTYVEAAGSERIPPTAKEAAFTIAEAKRITGECITKE